MDSTPGGIRAAVKDLVSIVIPVRHEGQNIPPLFDALRDAVHAPCEILIVYDTDDDSTLPVVHSLAPTVRLPVRLVKNTLGPGPANALRSGCAHAAGDAVVVLMADLSDDVTLIDRMLELFRNDYDVVCASRYMAGGELVGGPWFKGALSRLAGLTLYYLVRLPTHDPTNSFKLYRTAMLQSLRIESRTGFEISLEITVKAWALGWRVTELPTRWVDRVAGKSKFQLWRWLPRYLRWYMYALRASLRPRAGVVSRRTRV